MDIPLPNGTISQHGPERDALEAAIVRKAAWRLLPFLTLCYLVAYLDRSNISIAALTMMPALGLNAAQFGIAAGIFFVGYFVGELPSNLLQVRYGARRWLGRIMISWGIVAAGMAFVSSFKGLIILRVLLGIAEAGFVPGVVIYLAFWFPDAHRAKIFGLLLVAIPASIVIGAPISAALLYLDGIAGLAGWQWLFIVEGLPALFLGIACFYVLPENPDRAKWLSAQERVVLKSALDRERNPDLSGGHAPVRYALSNRKTWEMTIVMIGVCAGSYGAVFFLPQIIAAFGVSKFATGVMTTLPFTLAAFAMVYWGWHSDRTKERRWHMALPMFLSAGGFALAAMFDTPVIRIGAFVIAAMGIYMAISIFWHFVPMHFEEGAKAAAAVAIINMIGNLAGFVQPAAMGYFKVTTGGFETGLALTAVVVAVTGGVAMRMALPAKRRRR